MMRVLAVITSAFFFFCVYVLSRGKLWGIILALLGWPSSALAGCQTHTVLRPDGSQMLCTTCCDYQGICQTSCI